MIEKIKNSPFIHPLLFGIYPILFLYVNNAEIVSFSDLTRSLLIILSVIFLTYIVTLVLFKYKHKLCQLASLLIIFFFSYGHIRSLIPDIRWHIGNYVLYPNTVLIPIWGFCLLILSILILRIKKKSEKLSLILNATSFLLIFTVLITGLSGYFKSEHKSWTVTDFSSSVSAETYPNIYYLILDGYAGQKQLSAIFNFDNHDFIKALEDRNFFVGKNSQANYCQTILSLSSSLNSIYLDEIAENMGEETSDRKMLIQMIKDSNARSFLRQFGYQFVAYSSGYYGTEISSADKYITQPGMLNEFEEILLNTTPLPIVMRKFKSIKLHRERILYNLNQLAKTSSYDSPVFVFAHLICPHPPFIFDENGNPTASDNFQVFAQGKNGIWPSSETSEKNFTRQISFINKKVISIVDSLLANSETPPIIIIQGDHGSLFPREGINDTLFYKEKFSILNALHLPGYDLDSLSNNISPVNSFRIIFNHYFKSDYELLPDESYFSEWGKPYKFERVTDIIQQ